MSPGHSILPLGQLSMSPGHSILPLGQLSMSPGHSILPLGQLSMSPGHSILPMGQLCHLVTVYSHWASCVTWSQYTPTGPAVSPGHSILPLGQMSVSPGHSLLPLGQLCHLVTVYSHWASCYPVTVYSHWASWLCHLVTVYSHWASWLSPGHSIQLGQPVTRPQYIPTGPAGCHPVTVYNWVNNQQYLPNKVHNISTIFIKRFNKNPTHFSLFLWQI